LGIGRHVIGRLFMGGADGFAPGIRAEGVDVFVLGEVQGLARRGYKGEKQVPRYARDDTGALAAVALAGLKTAATKAKSRSLAALVMTWGAGGPSAKVKEHKEERSLEPLVDMGVLQRERLDLGFFGESRGGEAHY
jgi:hypothetical protein